MRPARLASLLVLVLLVDVDTARLGRAVGGSALSLPALLARIDSRLVRHRGADLLAVARLEAHAAGDVADGARDIAHEGVDRISQGAGLDVRRVLAGLDLGELLGPLALGVAAGLGGGGGVGGVALGLAGLLARVDGGLVGDDGAGDALAISCVADAAAGHEAAYCGLGGVC